MEAIKRKQNLKNIYYNVRAYCLNIENKKYNGLPIDENWLTFDDFVKDNWVRYYRAIIKWQNYSRLDIRKNRDYSGGLKNSHVRFIMKNPLKGYTKENTVFTSPSDMSKYLNATHKYMFDDRLLGTRDIQNILKKKGIHLTMEGITRRLNNGEDLFTPNVYSKILWKGKYMSFVQIADLEKINLHVLKKRYAKLHDINSAVEVTKTIKQRGRYLFEDKMLLKSEIARIFAIRLDMDFEFVRGILINYNFKDVESLTKFLELKKHELILNRTIKKLKLWQTSKM